ncbi:MULTISPECIES: hypothetical protein [Halomonadaceae]|uniref:hypothetical protein n=1 Tax=Halomonadaceae TaxID=28256 RepID=UPI001B8AED74|nr:MULTISPECIES: hypothetical protein [Halomonas]MBS3667903.1 hypothetical protein [Halomonas boliviensis]UZH12167.1 hypothetical protein OM794_10700 [Halomonas sp. BDJS001]
MDVKNGLGSKALMQQRFKDGNFRMLGHPGKAPSLTITLMVDFKIKNSNICLA